MSSEENDLMSSGPYHMDYDGAILDKDKQTIGICAGAWPTPLVVELLNTAHGRIQDEFDKLCNAMRHTHSPTEFGGDTCKVCGLDVRHEVHQSKPAPGSNP